MLNESKKMSADNSFKDKLFNNRLLQMTIFNPGWLLILVNFGLTYILDHHHQILEYIAASHLHWYSYLTYGFFSLNPIVWLSNTFTFLLLGIFYVYLRPNTDFKKTLLMYNGIWFAGSIIGGLLASLRLPGMFLLGPSAGLVFSTGFLLVDTLFKADLRLLKRILGLIGLGILLWYENSGVATMSNIIHQCALSTAIVLTFVYLIGNRIGTLQRNK